jgi:hypothetical protein
MGGLFGTAWRTAAVLLGLLAVTIVIGVVVCTIFDIAPLRARSAVLPYVIWLVLGVFCGLFAYNGAGGWTLEAPKEGTDWTAHPDARRTGRVIVGVSTAIIAALAYGAYAAFWSKGVNGEFFVPDSAPHSIVFFLAVLGAIAGTHHVLVPDHKPGG